MRPQSHTNWLPIFFLTLVFNLFCAHHSEAADGYWKMTQSQKVDQLTDGSGYTERTTEHRDGSLTIHFQRHPEAGQYEHRHTWTVPPAKLVPGQKVTMTVTVKNGRSIAMDHKNTQTMALLFGSDVFVEADPVDGPEGLVSKTTEAEVPGPGAEKIQIVVSCKGVSADAGWIYVYKWQPGGTPEGTLTPTPPGPPTHNLSGGWKCVWKAKNWTGQTRIEQTGDEVCVYPPAGSPQVKVKAHFENGNTLVVPAWGERGTITDNGKTIRWENGSYWTR